MYSEFLLPKVMEGTKAACIRGLFPEEVGRYNFGGSKNISCPYFCAAVVWPMIVSFHDNETSKVWEGQFSRKLPHDIQQVARRKLRMLNNASRVDDLRIPPQNRLEKLSGDREGQWSIRINDQWRLCFLWNEGTASRVEICDYH